ncbi:MAG: hypothetical protein RIB98_17140 [Acidimicrobiales bacterium]
MAFKRAQVEAWTTSTFPGERLVSLVPTGQGNGNAGYYNSPEDRRRRLLVEQLALDPDGITGAGYGTTFFVLTEQRLALGTRSSVRNRPKDLLHSAPVDGVRVWWFDHDAGAGNLHRHFVTDFGDGRWRADYTGLAALGRRLGSNADDFVAALGERATEATGV